jgi:NADH-quinone oxidoreductase subunit M
MLLFCGMMLLIEICLVGAFSCTSIFVFLLFFEASALPIFILIAYCGSARRERLKASYYFLFFTLYGSLSLLLLLLNFYSLSQLQFSEENLPLQSSNLTL